MQSSACLLKDESTHCCHISSSSSWWLKHGLGLDRATYGYLNLHNSQVLTTHTHKVSKLHPFTLLEVMVPSSTSSRRDGRVLISYLYFYGACRLLWLTWLDVVCCCLIIQASSGWRHKWTDNWLVWLRSERLDYSKNRIHIPLLIPREGGGEYTRDLGSFRNPRAVVSSCALHPTILPPCAPNLCSHVLAPRSHPPGCRQPTQTACTTCAHMYLTIVVCI